jgi:hypothetical protein
MTTLTPLDGLQLAIKKAGNKARLMEALNLTSGAINFWRQGIPVKRVIDVSRVTGIPCHILRPDYFPAPDSAVMCSVATDAGNVNSSSGYSDSPDGLDKGIKG